MDNKKLIADRKFFGAVFPKAKGCLFSVFVLILCVFMGGCGKSWPEQTDKVKLGMSRADVEQLLPRHVDSPVYVHFTYKKSDKYQSVSYWLDTHTKVTIAYDYTDTEPFLSGGGGMGMVSVFEASPTTLKGAHPNNKVVQVPELTEETIPQDESGVFYTYDFGMAASEDKSDQSKSPQL